MPEHNDVEILKRSVRRWKRAAIISWVLFALLIGGLCRWNADDAQRDCSQSRRAGIEGCRGGPASSREGVDRGASEPRAPSLCPPHQSRADGLGAGRYKKSIGSIQGRAEEVSLPTGGLATMQSKKAMATATQAHMQLIPVACGCVSTYCPIFHTTRFLALRR